MWSICVCVSCRQCCVGTELVDWLVLQSACVLTRSHAVGMWQALLEEGVLNHGGFLSHAVNGSPPKLLRKANKHGHRNLLLSFISPSCRSKSTRREFCAVLNGCLCCLVLCSGPGTGLPGQVPVLPLPGRWGRGHAAAQRGWEAGERGGAAWDHPLPGSDWPRRPAAHDPQEVVSHPAATKILCMPNKTRL